MMKIIQNALPPSWGRDVFFPNPLSVMLCWWFKTVTGGSIYTMEINKTYKSGVLFSGELAAEFTSTPVSTLFHNDLYWLQVLWIIVNYTESLSASWTLVEIRNIFQLNAFFCCCGRKHPPLRTCFMYTIQIHTHLGTVGGTSQQCLYKEMKSPCEITSEWERKWSMQVWTEDSAVSTAAMYTALSSFFPLKYTVKPPRGRGLQQEQVCTVITKTLPAAGSVQALWWGSPSWGGDVFFI